MRLSRIKPITVLSCQIARCGGLRAIFHLSSLTFHHSAPLLHPNLFMQPVSGKITTLFLSQAEKLLRKLTSKAFNYALPHG